MSTRLTPPRTIARWPFVAGDVIFFGLAVTALVAGGMPPPLGNIVTAFICAALGCGLLLVPFLLEYEGRLRVAEAGTRDAAGAQFRRLAQTSEQLANVVSRSQATEEQAGQVLGNLEELSDRLAAQSEELSQMLARVAQGQESISKPDAERLAAEAGARFDELAATITRLQERFESVLGKTVTDLAAIDRNLRALEDSSPRSSREKPATADHPNPTGLDLESRPAAFEKPPPPVKSPSKKRSAASSPAARKAGDGGGALELALDEPENHELTAPTGNASSSTAALVATAYIGIGNKLFLRGKGPGLSWERGVPMEFLAIGKWGWKTTEAVDTVNCRIYRNDDTPMLDEDIVVAAGEKKEVTPRF